MTAGRAALVVLAVVAVASAGPVSGGGGAVGEALEAGATVTDRSGSTPVTTPNNSSASSPSNDSTATALDADGFAVRTLSETSIFGRTGSGVVVVDEHGRVLLRAFVVLNCTTLAVDATPERRRYALRLAFVHADTGQRQELYAGPLNGTVTDPFGRTPLVLVRVDLRFLGRTVLSRTIPAGCPGPDASAA